MLNREKVAEPVLSKTHTRAKHFVFLADLLLVYRRSPKGVDPETTWPALPEKRAMITLATNSPPDIRKGGSGGGGRGCHRGLWALYIALLEDTLIPLGLLMSRGHTQFFTTCFERTPFPIPQTTATRHPPQQLLLLLLTVGTDNSVPPAGRAGVLGVATPAETLLAAVLPLRDSYVRFRRRF